MYEYSGFSISVSKEFRGPPKKSEISEISDFFGRWAHMLEREKNHTMQYSNIRLHGSTRDLEPLH